MRTINRVIRKQVKVVIIACCLLLTGLGLAVPGAHAQTTSYNPYLIQGIIDRTTTGTGSTLLPVEFNGTGFARFDVGNTGSTDIVVVPDDEMTLVITLSKGVPNAVNPLDALSGNGVEWFEWQYDPTIRTYYAKQIETIPGLSRRTIIIDYRVTENSFLGSTPTVSNGFNVNLQPPGYTNPQPTDDDSVSSYTYVEARDYGDAPISYGSVSHAIDVTKDLDSGTYNRYIFLGSYVDPELAYQASPDALGDDNNQTGGLGVDDEDGVTFPSMTAGETVTIPVVVTIVDQDDVFAARRLSAWIDWNGNGVFEESERIATNQSVLSSGTVNLVVTVPVDAITSRPTFARFRIGPTVGGPTGDASYGEVEDYMIQILNQPGSISGTILIDTTGDGIGNTLHVGVTVVLLDENGNPVLDENGDAITTTTDENGNYTFGDLPPGTYQVAQTVPVDYTAINDVDGGDLTIIGDVTPITIASGQIVTDQDFVNQQPGSISGTILIDTTGDGFGDAPHEGVIVALLDENGDPVLDSNGDPITTVTDENGDYSFTDVPPGTYQVAQTVPDGYVAIDDVDGGDLTINGDVTRITVAPGQDITDQDFVNRQAPTDVALLSFDVVPVDATALRVGWSTASEENVQGFHLWRSETDDRSQAVQITPEMIESKGTLLSGAEYHFIDGPLQSDTQYYYWLQEIETTGKATEFGPATGRTPALPGEEPDTHHQIYLPFLNR
jgi:hypothetical protein